MKGKSCVHTNRCLVGVFHSGCWVVVRPGRRKRQERLAKLFTRYRKKIDVLLAVTAIGGMFLLGIWGFLVQLAEI